MPVDSPSMDFSFPHLAVYSMVAVLNPAANPNSISLHSAFSQLTFPAVTPLPMKSTMTNLMVGGTQPLAPLSTPSSLAGLSQLLSTIHFFCVAM